MKQIKLNARAKINITLDVIRKREDGYHDLSMIMQSVNLCDNLTISINDSGMIELTSNYDWLPCDERNLVYKAAALMKEKYGIKEGIRIHLEKNIPVAAGMAGGSSDCAATLVGIRNLLKINASDEELMTIGKTLGADVPYCILRGTALAEGIGEKLTKLPPFPDSILLIAKPPINVSTAAVFGSLDLSNVDKHPDNDKMIELIKNKDLKGICENMCNVLESVTVKNYPIINNIKKAMTDNGALGSLMSGSGPTVFGFFESYDKALNALKYIRAKHHIKEIYITTVFNTIRE
ncbi:MAG: 4-(cytidine 5'-diphospho)-2-C-methyl-D-erythritol kinase [Clostridia bacterium]|nr:4-(cytidine 5'-diphospho)-2-C-methyl-D-erythritol kinase [Clostridia bacterium]